MGSLTHYVYFNSIAKALWDTIDSHNQSFSKIILALSESAAQHPKEYQKMVKYLSTLQSVQVKCTLSTLGYQSLTHGPPFLVALTSRPVP